MEVGPLKESPDVLLGFNVTSSRSRSRRVPPEWREVCLVKGTLWVGGVQMFKQQGHRGGEGPPIKNMWNVKLSISNFSLRIQTKLSP